MLELIHVNISPTIEGQLPHGIPMDTILSAAGWSDAITFDQFYNKDITEQGLFASSVL